jgi:hypothetical protein
MPRQIWIFIQRILLAASGVLVALIVLEMGARLLPPPYEDTGDKADICSNQLGWRGRPNFTSTVGTDDYFHNLTLSSVGMHDTDHPKSKPANTFRIMMLGDSFVRAHQVREKETSHQVLENLLNSQDLCQNIEVMNAGVDGWGTGQELLYYRNEGRYYQPDLVLLMFYISNDMADNLPGRGITLDGRNCYAPYFVLCGDQLDPNPRLFAPGIRSPLGDCSFGKKILSNVLGRIYQSSRLYNQIEPLLATRPPGVSALDYYTNANEAFDYSMQLTIALVKQLEEEVRKDGAGFAVVLISPSDLIDFTRMSAGEREEVYQRLPFMRRAEEIPPPNQFLVEVLTNEGIEVLDLLPSFVEHIDKTGEMFRFQNDKHWNVAGNRLAAETIYRWLIENYEFSEGRKTAF